MAAYLILLFAILTIISPALSGDYNPPKWKAWKFGHRMWCHDCPSLATFVDSGELNELLLEDSRTVLRSFYQAAHNGTALQFNDTVIFPLPTIKPALKIWMIPDALGDSAFYDKRYNMSQYGVLLPIQYTLDIEITPPGRTSYYENYLRLQISAVGEDATPVTVEMIKILVLTNDDGDIGYYVVWSGDPEPIDFLPGPEKKEDPIDLKSFYCQTLACADDKKKASPQDADPGSGDPGSSDPGSQFAGLRRLSHLYFLYSAVPIMICFAVGISFYLASKVLLIMADVISKGLVLRDRTRSQRFQKLPKDPPRINDEEAFQLQTYSATSCAIE